VFASHQEEIAMRTARQIELLDVERVTLTKWSRGRSTPARVVLRAKIVLLAAEGRTNQEIAQALGTSRKTVGLWRTRFAEQRLAGIQKDAPRRGRTQSPKIVKEILRRTTQQKPPGGATHWSTRSMGEAVGVSRSLVQRVWQRHNLQPHRVKTFKVSNDPRFEEKLCDVVGLYLDPPEHAIVLSVDEKSQIQALNRTQKSLPMFPGRLGTLTHDYKRNGTTTLFAAYNIAEGTVLADFKQRHRHREWLDFLQTIDEATDPELDIHIICDNYATHKHAKVRRWLARHPRFHVHFTPTSSSWLNLVERWFRDLTQKCIRRGSFTSVAKLEAAIWDYIDHTNDHPTPFRWTVKPGDILHKVAKARAALHKTPTE
jgi:transposase